MDEGDYLAGMVSTAMIVLEHLDLLEYFSRFSNRIFGDRWKTGLLVLKEFLDMSYEDLVKILPSMKGILSAGTAPRIPHKDTLRKFSGRLPEGILDRVIGETARLLCGSDVIAAVDSTGFSESNASRHFVKRLKHLGTEDSVARGYEPKSRRSAHKNYPHGWYRTRMFLDFDSGTYALRSLVETVNSMIKRKTGEIVFGKTLASMAREIKFACIAHNVRLLIDSGLARI